MCRKLNLPVLFVLASVLCLAWGVVVQADVSKPAGFWNFEGNATNSGKGGNTEWEEADKEVHVADSAAQEKEGSITLDTDPHLVGWWKFDDTSGNTAVDSSKHRHNGTLKGDLSFDKSSVPGKIERALKLGGGEDYVQIAKYKGVAGTQPRTVAAWVKTTASTGQIVSWGADDYGKMWIFGFIRGRIGVTPNGGYLYINDAVHDDEWHHVAAVVEKADLPNLHDDVKLYKDGTQAEIHDIGLLDLWPIDTGSDMDVTIGRRFKGLLDDVRIYDRPLVEDEINALFMLQSNRPLPK
jgi:hypothetical protein